MGEHIADEVEAVEMLDLLPDQLNETWRIHQRINLYLLESIPDNALPNVAPSKGRSVGAQFAHLHNVRLMWLDAAAKPLREGLEKLEGEHMTFKAVLSEALTASGVAVEQMVRDALNGDGRIKGFKPHAVAFVGYLIAHEAHHRGQILLTMKQTGAPVDKKVRYGMWEWGVR